MATYLQYTLVLTVKVRECEDEEEAQTYKAAVEGLVEFLQGVTTFDNVELIGPSID